MKTRYIIQFGIAAAAAFLLSACSTTDSNVNTANEAAKTDSSSYNGSQFRPQTPSAPIGSVPGRHY